MLKVQEYLRKFDTVEAGLDALYNEFGIANKRHPTDSRVILDYDQITSPKFHPIVRECRGLVLDCEDDWNIVARGFFRFFNYGEGSPEQNYFSFDGNFTASDKEDGSVIFLYFYKGEWRINTRFSFADSKVNESDYTWEELFWLAVKDMHKVMLVTGRTYVFELCSIYNKVVRHYPEPTIYLLSCFDNGFGSGEKDSEFVNLEARFLNVKRPKSYTFNSIDNAIAHIKSIECKDATFEGLVIRDCYNNRLKIKSASYLVLHKKLGNRKPSIEDLYMMGITDDGGDEYLAYFPELKEKLDAVRVRRKIIEIKLIAWYEKAKSIESQKEFALTVKDLDLGFALFAMRKGLTLREVLVQYAKRFVELIEKDFNDYPAPTERERADFAAELRAGESLPA